jgi:hypothetical protein
MFFKSVKLELEMQKEKKLRIKPGQKYQASYVQIR